MTETFKYVKKEHWNDIDQFLRYVESHSETPRALFHKSQVAEMCFLHGDEQDADDVMSGVREWYSIDFSDWVEEIKTSRRLINEANNIINSNQKA